MKISGNYLKDHLRKDGFVACVMENADGTMRYTGRDQFHKIALISGKGEIHYDDRAYNIDGSVILMTTPGKICSWELSGKSRPMYVITFTDVFIKKDCEEWAEECATYFNTNPVFALRPEEESFMRSIFSNVLDEQTATYSFKEELVRDQICVISHLAFKKTPLPANIQMTDNQNHPAAAVRLELVEHHFPAAAQILHLN